MANQEEPSNANKKELHVGEPFLTNQDLTFGPSNFWASIELILDQRDRLEADGLSDSKKGSGTIEAFDLNSSIDWGALNSGK